MAVIDLTLNRLMLPGLANYTPPFGTKKAADVALKTEEGCNNFTLPFELQRPVIISENSSCNGNIEHNSLVEIDTASVTFTLTNGAYKGCRLTILATFSSGTANLLHNSVAIPMAADSTRILEWTGTAWRNVNQSEIGAVQAYLGASDPDSKDWLVLDGRDTTGTAIELATVYPRLYKFLGNTNVLPDYRGEFLRGAGTNSHTGEGNGAAVGVHQAGTRAFSTYVNDQNSYIVYGLNNTQYKQYDATQDNLNINAITSSGSGPVLGTVPSFTLRPTNTSVNWIICAR